MIGPGWRREGGSASGTRPTCARRIGTGFPRRQMNAVPRHRAAHDALRTYTARMDAIHLRPTFDLAFPLPREEATRRLCAGLAEEPGLSGRWHAKGRWAELHVPAREMRLWSPCLSIRMDDAEAGSTLHGRFGPRPEVWTFFMFLYALIAFLTLFGSTLAYVQWSSAEPAWALWAVWLGVPALGLMHVAAWVAQRRSRRQMARLRAELERVVDTVEGLRPRPSEPPAAAP